MKIKKIKYVVMVAMAVSFMIIPNSNVNAALQANPNTHEKKGAALGTWIDGIRKMEVVDGVMGLAETLNDDYTPKESNGIDVHCMKTTEYGAMAILASSGYGNPSNDKVIETTTGNNTGVYMSKGTWEWTAGGGENVLTNVNARYIDRYGGAKPGDALGNGSESNKGCAGWHSAGFARWVSGNHASDAAFPRGGSNGLYAFDGCWDYGYPAYTRDIGWPGYGWLGRAVVVCGDGL